MWVKEVVIDGFKSYANRTAINGWDPSFTAITGLNGSGKSNILDAICFVLGISNLSQVRAANLQDLVYKQGQARVNKASVTIVFDNGDAKSSPVGYESHAEITVTRQVVIGGRNKYLINGHTAQLSRVQNLFHSVQLNVNNPHFLIMQGRITKVVNMKPLEVLSMIEEAAGTRMYENKKKNAQKTIQKKQSKVEEINKILHEEITPTLERLRKDRSLFMQWSNNNTEIERLNRFCAAANFWQLEGDLRSGSDEVRKMESEVEECNRRARDAIEHIDDVTNKLKQISSRENAETNKLKSFEDRMDNRSKELVKITSGHMNHEKTVLAERKDLDAAKQAADEAKSSLAKKQDQYQSMKRDIDDDEKKHTILSERIAGLQGSLLGIGMSGANGKDQGTLTSQLMECQKQIARYEGELKQLTIRSKASRESAISKRDAAKREEKEFGEMSKKLERATRELNKISGRLLDMKFDGSSVATSERRVQQLSDGLRSLRDDESRLSAQLQQLMFDEWQSPERGFDRSRVRGRIATLITIDDVKKYGPALEVAAGGRLYHVVVDSEHTGKDILQRGKLRQRVTILPLDKISGSVVSREKKAKAIQLVGDGHVSTALELTSYDMTIERAIQHVFGNIFICETADDARTVCFDAAIKTRSVSLLGDSYEPGGTLSGGSAPRGGSVLVKWTQLVDLRQQIASDEKSIVVAQEQLRELSAKDATSRELTTSKELLEHEVGLLKSGIDQSQYSQLNDAALSFDRQEIELKEQSQRVRSSLTNENKHAAELERSIQDFEGEQKNKVKDIERQISSCKKEQIESSRQLKKLQNALEQVRLEVASLKEELGNSSTDLRDKDDSLRSAESTLTDLSHQVDTHKRLYDEAKSLYDAERDRVAANNTAMNKLSKEKTRLEKVERDAISSVKALQHKIKNIVADQKDARTRLVAMNENNEWLASEKHLFGKPGTDYDFVQHPPKQSQTRLNTLKNDQERLNKQINRKVLTMFEKAEQEYDDLMKKKQIVEGDKNKIEEVIIELDRKKNEALETTWKKVTRDFGSIFGTLLPGTKAKLEPPEGKTVLDGLEVKVAFGDAWKDSLSELSGGQRSLLALSLILALLMFKPAPMYILDEIDAALDLSHTQNIGTMLKTHFPQSQFIVVSLKEGMFNNANVVFRTKFVDGVSCVTRTALTHKHVKKGAAATAAAFAVHH